MTGIGPVAGRILESGLRIDHLLSHFLTKSPHIFETQFPHFCDGQNNANSPGKSNEKVCI